MENNTAALKPALNSTRIARIIGVILSVLAVSGILYAIIQWSTSFAELKGIPDSVSPAGPFPNVMNLTHSLSNAISLAGFCLIMLALGVYRIITGRKSRAVIFIAFFIVFAMGIGVALYVNSVREDVYDELVSSQHQWADSRYGIIYDEVTVHETTDRKNQTIKNQDSVIWEGEIIAKVCPKDEHTVVFCDPDTGEELTVFSY